MGEDMKFLALLISVPLVVVLIVSFSTNSPKVSAATTRVDLLTGDNFAVLGGSAISNVPTSVIIGDVGLSPTGGASITGLTCGEVTGTIYDTNGGYTGGGGGSTACRSTNAGLLTIAKNDLTTSYNDAAGRTTTSTIATDLAGATLTDGVYDSAAGTFGITGGGTLTLNGQGNANAVFIFKMASTLITSSSSKVVLTNSAQPCNVYWQVGSSATLGTSSTLIGDVLALTSITDNGSSTVNGRLLARNGAVTLNKTTITKQTCAVGTTGGPATATSATLHVVKHVVNDDSGRSTASHFTLHVKLSGTDVAGSPAGGVESPGTAYSLAAGTYNVSEDAHGAYSSSFSGYCNADGNITLAAADNKTCTITNDLLPVAASAPAAPPPGPSPCC